MKTVQKITLFIALIALFASCQPSTDVTKILSNQDTKKAIMDTIANDSNLSVEMMENNPAMMQSMMNGMMETFKGDTAMMSSMSSFMLKNPQMMNMIHKNMGADFGMKGMNHMEGMNPKTK